jgi:Icc-related predicted phosphoesterase
MSEAQRFMRDFSVVRIGAAPFTPQASAELFAQHAAWLEERLAAPHAGPTVVITHHAPSPRSIHPRFAGSPLNACFVSDAERLIDARRVQLWIHGHTHDSFDYRVAGTRVVCNARGYAKDGVNENPSFDANLRVEIAVQ